VLAPQAVQTDEVDGQVFVRVAVACGELEAQQETLEKVVAAPKAVQHRPYGQAEQG